LEPPLFQLLYHPVASVGFSLTLPQTAEIIEEMLIKAGGRKGFNQVVF
jgi:hypothetical protein